MKIQRATFLGVRGVPDVTLDLTDPRTHAPFPQVIVTGPSGSGKTRLLEALVAAKEAIGAYGIPAPSASWVASGTAAKIRIAFHLDESEQAFAGTTASMLEAEVIFDMDRARTQAEEGLRALLGRYSHDPALGKLEYFPSSRKIPLHPPFSGTGSAEQRILRAGKDPRKYSFVLTFLRSLEQDKARAAAFAARLAAFGSSCVYAADPSGEVIPRCFSSHGASLSVFELAEGEADAVILAATALAIGLDHSILLLDRPDLHLTDVTRLHAALGGLGQDNQLIIAAGSALAAAANGAHVVGLRGEP